MGALAAYLLAINLAAATAFALDKRRAVRRGGRLRERTLLGLALAGGSAGALLSGALVRHKTRKASFAWRLWAIAILQAALALAVLVLAHRSAR